MKTQQTNFVKIHKDTGNIIRDTYIISQKIGKYSEYYYDDEF